jgi:hypothetical protein
MQLSPFPGFLVPLRSKYSLQHPILYISRIRVNRPFLSVSGLIMECKQFKEFAKDMVDYVGDYLENIRDR